MRICVFYSLVAIVFSGCSESQTQFPESTSPASTINESPASFEDVAAEQTTTGAIKPEHTHLTSIKSDDDWPWWRGTNHNGVANEQGTLPVNWSETKNVIWQTPVPGRGHSSPVVVGDRIYLATADKSKQQQGLVAFERSSGKQLWMRVLNEGGLPARNHRKNTEASPTAAWRLVSR